MRQLRMDSPLPGGSELNAFVRFHGDKIRNEEVDVEKDLVPRVVVLEEDAVLVIRTVYFLRTPRQRV